MRSRLDWGPVEYRPRNIVERTLTAADLDHGTRRAIEAENALDLELYRWAEVQLDKELAGEGVKARR